MSNILKFTTGQNVDGSKNIIANEALFTPNGIVSNKDMVVLFTAPKKCILNGTLTLTASGNTAARGVHVTHRRANIPIASIGNGYTFQQIVIKSMWYESGIYLKNSSMSKSITLSMEEGEMLAIWNMEKTEEESGTVALSLSGSYQ